jgi:hypothetical protein
LRQGLISVLLIRRVCIMQCGVSRLGNGNNCLSWIGPNYRTTTLWYDRSSPFCRSFALHCLSLLHLQKSIIKSWFSNMSEFDEITKSCFPLLSRIFALFLAFSRMNRNCDYSLPFWTFKRFLSTFL